MRSLLAVLLAYALLAPEIGTAQSGTAVSAAVADSVPVAVPTTKKKKGLFGKVKGLANNKIVKTVAKTALCMAVPGGQMIAGALDAVDKKSVTGAANAVSGGGCTPGMAGMVAPGGPGAAGLGAAAAGALGARGTGARVPGQPFTGMPGMAMSPEQLKQIQDAYAKMGMNPVQLRAMQQMMAGMAAGTRSEQAAEGMAISPEQLQQAMAQYRRMGMDPAQLAAMQPMMASVAAPPGKQALRPAASAGSGAPPVTTEKGRLVLRQLPWTPGAETISPGSESAFELAVRKLGAAMLATTKRYKVEARVEEQGGKSPNRLLARKRAEAVVAALREQGISAERLTVSDGGADKDPRMVIAER
jgi:hypothetical protein